MTAFATNDIAFSAPFAPPAPAAPMVTAEALARWENEGGRVQHGAGRPAPRH